MCVSLVQGFESGRCLDSTINIARCAEESSVGFLGPDLLACDWEETWHSQWLGGRRQRLGAKRHCHGEQIGKMGGEDAKTNLGRRINFTRSAELAVGLDSHVTLPLTRAQESLSNLYGIPPGQGVYSNLRYYQGITK